MPMYEVVDEDGVRLKVDAVNARRAAEDAVEAWEEGDYGVINVRVRLVGDTQWRTFRVEPETEPTYYAMEVTICSG